MGPTTSYAGGFVDQLMLGLAVWSLKAAQGAVSVLLNAFGDRTEPDFHAIAPVYDRMLAIALLITGAVIAFGLIETILGGSHGLGWNVVPRTLVAIFFAFAGIQVVEYLAHYAALLATTWTPDLLRIDGHLSVAGQVASNGRLSGHVSPATVASLIIVALLTDVMAVLVYLELVVRGALMLLVTSFVPLVCALSIWPRTAGAIAHLAEFLVGLLLCKFVVATAVYVGYSLVLASVQADPHGDWVVSGLAILCIAAFSPVVLVQALRFTHSTAGSVARGWAATGVSLLPTNAITSLGRRGFGRIGGSAGRWTIARAGRLRKEIRRS